MTCVQPTTLVSNVGHSILKFHEGFSSPIPEHTIMRSMFCICNWKNLIASDNVFCCEISAAQVMTFEG